MRILNLVLFIHFWIYCQSVNVRNSDAPYDSIPKVYYSDTELAAPGPLDQNAQQYYKVSRRSDRIPAPTFQYTIPEESIPGSAYAYTPEQPPQPTAEENPSISREYALQPTQTVGAVARRPQVVEQYLKEVTPTTKTTVNRRAGNPLRQTRLRGAKQQPDETQRVPKQPPFQYVLHSELQQQPQIPQQIQYVLPEQLNKKSAIQLQQTSDQQQDPASLTRYQNALLAHQKILLDANAQEETPKSSIYVNQAIPKKPVRKLLKPKQSPVDEDVEYYTQLQRYQQQLQQAQFFEQQQPAQVMFQAKLQAAKESATPTAEAVTYQEKTIRYQQPRQYQQIVQYQPPTSIRQAKKTRRPSKYPTAYQPVQDGSEPTYEYQTSSKQSELENVEHQRPTSLRQGPKYLPEYKALRYQPTTLEDPNLKYRQAVLPPQRQPLISYEAAIAKLQSEARLEEATQQPVYQEQEQAVQPKYQIQYVEENQQGSNQEVAEVDYARPEQATRLRQTGRGGARQPSQNSNVRYYRNLARPVPYSSYA